MNVPAILNAPWAIAPEKLIEMRNVYLSHLRGEKPDLASIEATIGRTLDSKRDGYKVENGVAVIPIEGIVAKKMNLFTQISGGTSTQALQQDIADAAADPIVHSIVLLIDSPGGEVDGTQAAADLVRSIRGKKPIVALADGLMASAAYWIGSAADKVYITGDTTAVGSIGIVATHTDYSKAEEQRGIKVTEITAGKYKRIASQHEPLSDEGRADIQSKVDHLYSVFVDAVAANRGVITKTVLDKMADGRVFLGKNAIAAGLVDGIDSLSGIITRLSRAGAKPAVSIKSTAPKAETQTASAEIASATRIPKDADYMERFRGYMLQGLCRADAMQRAISEHTLATQLAEVAQMHERREQTNPHSQGETKVMTHQTTSATSQANQDPITVAKELAEKAREYQRQQEALGNRITIAQAVEHVSKLNQSKTAATTKPGAGAVSRTTVEEKIAHAKEVAAKAQVYLAEQHKAGNTHVTIADAVVHVQKQQ